MTLDEVGGAERLIVDAAKTLQQRGHNVIIYTSHHSPKHCFEETKSNHLPPPSSFNGPGGYDLRVQENRDYLKELESFASGLGLTFTTIWPGKKLPIAAKDSQLLFMPSISDSMKNALLQRSLCLLYTPTEEHFGIVPVEAMSLGVPVIAMNSGGPRETVVNGITGFLCEKSPTRMGEKMEILLTQKTTRKQMSEQARQHVKNNFSLDRFGELLENNLLNLLSQ
ncbi:hypothetical protein PSACC_01470 [Paramicrosporidium saccamoebae]|uniref:Alpha-1,3/1,6-mannosyltransferase ALG2 n=1 Tax=Paramicrosporidium saccamoebae TaxID=1246581 RepID=A0A2H9TLW8_9FUNG|nr:hypothetical protein PSACC_01470 [Paramicrosporidium saccamoebae]